MAAPTEKCQFDCSRNDCSEKCTFDAGHRFRCLCFKHCSKGQQFSKLVRESGVRFD